MRLSIIVVITVLIIGSVVAISGFIINQEPIEISEITDISQQYAKLEKYKNELEKINQYNQQILVDLENQIKNSDNEQLEQINEEIEVVKRVINDNKEELEQVIQRLSKIESNP
jgi:predicted PurR-regulated permease PerM